MTASALLPVRIAETGLGLGGALLIGRNVSFRLASQVVSALINVAGMILLGNALGARVYGEYAFYYALVQLIASVGDAGIGVIVTREIARDREGSARLFGDAILIKSAVSGLILIVGLPIVWEALDAPRAALLTLVAVTALIDLSQDASIWALRAHERQDQEALLLLLSQLVWLLGLAVGVALKAGLFFMLAAATLGFAVRLAVGAAIVSRRLHRPTFQFDLARLRRLLVQGLPFGAAMFGVVLYGRVGLLMLKALGSPAEVGFFQVAFMLSQPLGFLASTVAIAVLPDLSRRVLRDAASVRRLMRCTIKAQFLMAFPMTIGLLLLAEPILSLLFPGRAFARSADGLRVMSLGLAFIFLNLVSRYVLAALDRQWDYLRAILLGIGTNVALCAALVPRWGSLGACVAYLGAEVAIWVVCQRALVRQIRFAVVAAEAAKPLLAAAGMGLVVWALRAGNVVLAVAAGAIAYLALLSVLHVFSEDEMRIFNGVCVSFGFPGSNAVPGVKPRA